MPRASSALRPLNSRGLWDAVTTTPPFRRPDFARKYCADGVGTTPRSTTSQPADIRPDAAARALIGPLSRVARPRAPGPPSNDVPIARPTFRARAALVSGPPTPRLPLDLQLPL